MARRQLIAALLAVAAHVVAARGGTVADVSLQPLPMKYGDVSRGGEPYAKDPTVIRHGGRYLMYYSIRGYQDKTLAPSNPAPFQADWHSGIAESVDLVRWKRVCDLDLRDTRGRRFWGAVAPCVKKFDGKIHLFYQRSPHPGGTSALWHAVSDDGLVFTNVADEPVFSPRNRWSNRRAIDAEAYRVGDELVLMYVTRDPSGKVQKLGLAKAPYASGWGPGDFVDQTVDAPLLEPEFPWEGHCIEAPTVIRREGVWYLFYAGAYNHERQMIGLATSSDGFHFRRAGADGLLLRAGPKGSWNAGESGHPGVFEDEDGRAYLFYQGKKSSKANYLLSVCKVEFRDRGGRGAAASPAGEHVCHAASFPDPTLWRGSNGVFYAYATTGGRNGQTYLTSEDGLTWRSTGKRPFSDETFARIKSEWGQVWAPDRTVVAGEGRLYVSLVGKGGDSAIAAFRVDGDTGQAYDLHVVTRSEETGIPDTIDPEVVTDPDSGRVWLFFGSVGKMHRVELTADGLAVRKGARYVHVAGRTDVEDRSRATVFEGAYLYRHDGWWYLFVSAGWYGGASYNLRVGRSRTLEGAFLDRKGRPMTEGFATPVLKTEPGDFYGPGHNGDFLTGADGVLRIYYHSHWRVMDKGDSKPRVLLARRLTWDKDGWPKTLREP